jgi:NAD(P)H-hydrate repair Nnr-like enzyme with NAD(P)H-hydrate dehydratase domain
VLTPHAGEAASLLGVTREAVEADRPAAARALSGGPCVAVLKGARTLVSDGERVVVTMTGGPGLATMGTGDVLAGVVGTLLAQGLAPLDAAALAAHLHGAAGDAASEDLTPVCCTAEDVLTYLAEAVRALAG